MPFESYLLQNLFCGLCDHRPQCLWNASDRDPSAFSLRTLISHQVNEMSVALDMKL